MEKNNNSHPTSTSNKYQVVINDEFDKNVTETVNFVLRKNAGGWICSDDIDEIASMACVDIWMKSSLFDPSKGASFKTWYTLLSHNFAISESKKLKNEVDRIVDLANLSGFDDGYSEVDPEKRSRSKKVNYRKDSTFSWAAQELGISIDEFNADYLLMKDADEKASMKRLAILEEFLDTKLSDKEKMMLEMLKEDRTTEEKMEAMNMSSNNVYTFTKRLREKIRNFMRSSDYYGIDE